MPLAYLTLVVQTTGVDILVKAVQIPDTNITVVGSGVHVHELCQLIL